VSAIIVRSETLVWHFQLNKHHFTSPILLNTVNPHNAFYPDETTSTVGREIMDGILKRWTISSSLENLPCSQRLIKRYSKPSASSRSWLIPVSEDCVLPVPFLLHSFINAHIDASVRTSRWPVDTEQETAIERVYNLFVVRKVFQKQCTLPVPGPHAEDFLVDASCTLRIYSSSCVSRSARTRF